MEINTTCQVTLTDKQIDLLTKLLINNEKDIDIIQSIVTQFGVSKAKASQSLIDKINAPMPPAKQAAEVFE